MKKLLTFSVAALIGLAVIPGCKKSSSSPAAMTATAGGTSFSASTGYALDTLGTVEIVGAQVSGSTVGGEIDIVLSTATTLATGSYTLDSLSDILQYTPSATNPLVYKISKSGTVTITSISPNAVGTFNCTCTDGTVISNGTFNVKIDK